MPASRGPLSSSPSPARAGRWLGSGQTVHCHYQAAYPAVPRTAMRKTLPSARGETRPAEAGTVTLRTVRIIKFLSRTDPVPAPQPGPSPTRRCSSAVRCARLWNPDAVHLLPADRSDHRVIDAERICQAIAALDSPEAIQARARQFAVLADPTRLTLLTCIGAAGPISVSDLAAATGINDATVSQTLRYLRASQTVIAERDGRVVRYRLASTTPITALLAG